MTGSTHYMGVPLHAYTEPTPAEKQVLKVQLRKEREVEQRAERAGKFFVMAPGTPVRTDVYGFKDHAAQVLRDEGPADEINRKITIQKISGRNAGESITVSRDRVMVSPT